MKILTRGAAIGFLAGTVGLGLVVRNAEAADFSVVSPGSSYTINTVAGNPTLTVVRGELYTFSISTSSVHPFQILNSSGVTNNNISSGTITWRVPTNAMNYRYECSIHHFFGNIVTIPPPSIRIVDLSLGANLIVKSTGTNNWTLLPQFSPVLPGNWSALTVQSNRFLNGTNETFCGRPPGSNIFVRMKAQRP